MAASCQHAILATVQALLNPRFEILVPTILWFWFRRSCWCRGWCWGWPFNHWFVTAFGCAILRACALHSAWVGRHAIITPIQTLLQAIFKVHVPTVLRCWLGSRCWCWPHCNGWSWCWRHKATLGSTIFLILACHGSRVCLLIAVTTVQATLQAMFEILMPTIVWHRLRCGCRSRRWSRPPAICWR